MEQKYHINVTVNYQQQPDKQMDLRVSTHQTVKNFIIELDQTLHIQREDMQLYQLKVVNKGILLSDNQKIHRYPVTTGDHIIIY
ncbi:EsaB/YukD family protein [Carnobacterium gallinarum]|uniref:EsaB/YukD family protein n=1 Tax=Carnobacterium gallinarum TaxID=2749 RepID=UPI000556803E|nr:EsaB/YukD family protein [Carnobacterium gallinarum]